MTKSKIKKRRVRRKGHKVSTRAVRKKGGMWGMMDMYNNRGRGQLLASECPKQKLSCH